MRESKYFQCSEDQQIIQAWKFVNWFLELSYTFERLAHIERSDIFTFFCNLENKKEPFVQVRMGKQKPGLRADATMDNKH